MAHENHPHIGALTLQGKHVEALRAAKEVYAADRTLEHLVMLTSTMYSAKRRWQKDRSNPEQLRRVTQDLMFLRRGLIGAVAPLFDARDADKLDVVATVLADINAEDAQIAAMEAAQLGIEISEGEPGGEHTRALLLLTYATLLFRRPWRSAAWEAVEEAEAYGMLADDPNQKARIFRKAAHLYLRHGRPFSGIRCLLALRSIPDLAPDVAAKNPV